MEVLVMLGHDILEANKKRPFKGMIVFIFFLSILGFFVSLFTEASAFAGGILLSLIWASSMYIFDLDLPHPLKDIRSGRASLGFFAVISGILIAVLGPNYLNTQPRMTEWLVVWGFLVSAQIGFSLLLTSPLRTLSACSGHLISAIVLHSVIIRFPNEFINGDTARVLVIFLLLISTWFFSQWLFFDATDPLLMDEPQSVKHIRSFVGVASGLLTVIEFFNVLYNIVQLSK